MRFKKPACSATGRSTVSAFGTMLPLDCAAGKSATTLWHRAFRINTSRSKPICPEWLPQARQLRRGWHARSGRTRFKTSLFRRVTSSSRPPEWLIHTFTQAAPIRARMSCPSHSLPENGAARAVHRGVSAPAICLRSCSTNEPCQRSGHPRRGRMLEWYAPARPLGVRQR